MTKNSWILIMTVAAVVVALVAFGRDGKAHAADTNSAQVKIDNFSFAPETLTVKAGTPITWTNGDDIPHTVVSEDQSFKSKVLDSEDKFTFAPSKPGTYSYYCSLHPKMTGKVVVQ